MNAHNIFRTNAPDVEADDPARPCDLHDRLIEAGMTGCCAEGDFLALMPSLRRDFTPRVDDFAPWVDGEGWFRRMLGV